MIRADAEGRPFGHPHPSSPEVLLVGLNLALADRIAEVAKEAMPAADMVVVRRSDRLPEAGPQPPAVIVLDGLRVGGGSLAVNIDPEVRERCVALVDVVNLRNAQFRATLPDLPVPLLLVGDDLNDGGARKELSRMLLGKPAARHLHRALSSACTPQQQRTVQEFLIRADVKTPWRLAQSLSQSRRTLTRRCAEDGLANPQALLRIARVARGVTWAHNYPGGERRAYLAAGYQNRDSLLRSARELLGASYEELLREWRDEQALVFRFGRVLAGK